VGRFAKEERREKFLGKGRKVLPLEPPESEKSWLVRVLPDRIVRKARVGTIQSIAANLRASSLTLRTRCPGLMPNSPITFAHFGNQATGTHVAKFDQRAHADVNSSSIAEFQRCIAEIREFFRANLKPRYHGVNRMPVS
jgi:hypothetical protein